MRELSPERVNYINEAIVRWQRSGVTHVVVIARHDASVCTYCRDAAFSIIPVTEIIQHCEQCLSIGECRCHFGRGFLFGGERVAHAVKCETIRIVHYTWIYRRYGLYRRGWSIRSHNMLRKHSILTAAI